MQAMVIIISGPSGEAPGIGSSREKWCAGWYGGMLRLGSKGSHVDAEVGASELTASAPSGELTIQLPSRLPVTFAQQTQ